MFLSCAKEVSTLSTLNVLPKNVLTSEVSNQITFKGSSLYQNFGLYSICELWSHFSPENCSQFLPFLDWTFAYTVFLYIFCSQSANRHSGWWRLPRCIPSWSHNDLFQTWHPHASNQHGPPGPVCLTRPEAVTTYAVSCLLFPCRGRHVQTRGVM